MDIVKQAFISLLLFVLYVSQAWGISYDWFDSAAASGPFLSDTFTELSSDTALASHSPETGGTWVELGGGTPLVYYTTDVVKTSTTGTSINYNNSSPGSADYSVTVPLVMNTTSGSYFAGPGARVQTDGSGYTCTIDGSGATAIWRRGTNGGYVTPALDTDTISGYDQATEYTVTITTSGTTISCTISPGSITMSATDSNITAAGYAGVFFVGSNATITSISAE